MYATNNNNSNNGAYSRATVANKMTKQLSIDQFSFSQAVCLVPQM